MTNFLKELKVPALTIILFFLCLLIYTRIAGPVPFAVNSIQTTKTDTFQVDGEGKATGVPNQATISFGVTKQASIVADAQNQTNTAVQKILDSLNTLGIEAKNIKTTDYSVQPNYNFGGATQTITGYTVTQTVEVKIQPLDKVNQTLDALTASGANIVGQIRFGFDDATQQKLEDEARLDAVNKAKQKAESLAQASGIHLGSIINVVETPDQGAPQPILMNAAKLDAGTAQQPSQVTPGENTISTTITISYQTY